MTYACRTNIPWNPLTSSLFPHTLFVLLELRVESSAEVLSSGTEEEFVEASAVEGGGWGTGASGA